MQFRLLICAIFLILLSACSDSSDNTPDSSSQTNNGTADGGGDGGNDGAQNSDTPDGEGSSTDENPSVPDSGRPESATYTLTFDASWSESSHPPHFPSNPHFSGLIGAVHNEQVIFWETGQIATDGIEVMAESGGKSSLRGELNTAIAAGSALTLIDAAGIGVSPGSVSIEFSVTDEYNELTLVSMLAPSPDWFVGVQNLKLFNGETFVESMTIDLRLYDAGTDSGLRYTSPNADTQPRDPITRLSNQPEDGLFQLGEPNVGRFVLQRVP